MAVPHDKRAPPAGRPTTNWRRPKKRLLRQVSHQVRVVRWRRHWCTYQRRCSLAGDRPIGTAGSIPRTGGHQPKDWQALFFCKKRLNDLTKLLEDDVGEFFLVWGLVFLRPFMYSWFLSLLLLHFGLVFQRFGGFPSWSRLTATREVVQLHRSSSLSLRWAGTSRFRFATVGAPSVPFGTGVRRESSKASGSRPRKLFSPFRVPATPSWIPDGRLHLDRGRCLTGLRRWRPISVRFPFWRDRLDSSHQCVADPCP